MRVTPQKGLPFAMIASDMTFNSAWVIIPGAPSNSLPNLSSRWSSQWCTKLSAQLGPLWNFSPTWTNVVGDAYRYKRQHIAPTGWQTHPSPWRTTSSKPRRPTMWSISSLSNLKFVRNRSASISARSAMMSPSCLP